ncbi:MAG: amino acid adenylation domain-containing protein [Alphaproteobacteria bacterium]|nr:amino acid adenylation domain-containing protein [Alphaproteobacteria bacterium]
MSGVSVRGAGANALVDDQDCYFQPRWRLKQVSATAAGDAEGSRSAWVLVSDGERAFSRPIETHFHELFERRCAKFGTRANLHPAIDYGQVSFSYMELLARADRLARFLLTRGVKPGQRIAILMDRSVNSYALVLAASKVAAAYVPLDASFPVDRVAFILKDSGVSHIFTLSSFSARFEGIAVPLTKLDECHDEIAKISAAPYVMTRRDIEADPLAYVIYTSGSTGQPKGVPIRQSSICNFLNIASELYGYRICDRVYQGMTLAFDFAIEEIWVPLIAGATLVPAPSQAKLVGNDLQEFLTAGRITALCCVPTLLATLDADLDGIRFLLVSGEACPEDVIAPWLVKGRRVLNAYGPTETTVTATWTVMQPNRPVTIGGPLPTYTIIIIDPDSGRPAAPGEAGEICVAGVALCDDYLNRPDQTERAFLDDFLNLPDNPSGRLYRTGDLGRFTDRNEIEYLGRIDTQVKIRGYRIELEEIEAVIRGIEGVGQAVVQPYQRDGSDTELAAYCTADNAAGSIDFEKIDATLRAALPGYMVPAYYEKLDGLPLLASTKVDRKGLPPPAGPRFVANGGDMVAPRTAREAELAMLLAEVLKLEQISVEADFFDNLGADSLKLAQFVTLIRKHTGIRRISMRQLYQHTTIAQLARVVDEAVAKAAEKSPPARGGAGTDSMPGETLQSGARKDAAERPACERTARVADCHAADPHAASVGAMVATGLAQIASAAVLLFVTVAAGLAGYQWASTASGWVELYMRVVVATSLVFFASSAMLIAVKWIVVGRFTTDPIPIYSVAYLRFWIARRAIQANPMNLFAGSPIYNVYLRLLGMRIGPDTLILAQPPACTDLVSIGANTVIRQDCAFPGYSGQNGYLYPGTIEIGSDVLICEATVLDINTKLGDGAQLGTTSGLLEGQSVPDGAIYQGSPAQPSNSNFNRTAPRSVSPRQKAVFCALQLTAHCLVSLPSSTLMLVLLVVLGLTSAGHDLETGGGFDPAALLLGSGFIYFGGIAFAMATILVVPRILNRFVIPQVAHPLYGVQFELSRSIARLSNNRLVNTLFGDSSMIVYWLSAIGYDLSRSTQTGSNFGVDQRHHSPFLCSFDRNTLVSDGLFMMNMEVSSSSFIMRRVSMPPDTYVGNDVHYPADSRLGPNCLIATKAAIPIDGPLRNDVGILGSPPFEIPRSVARDMKFDHYKQPGILEHRLALKLGSNLVTLALYLLRSWMLTLIGLVLGMWSLGWFVSEGGNGLMQTAVATTVSILLFTVFGALFSIFCERAACSFRRLEPRYCSLYDKTFWDHERFWKLNYNAFLAAFDGTPMKPFFLRLQGARVGRRVFDDGAGLTEPSLVEIGDDCMLNFGSSLQSHSLEDGTFKSDRIIIGNNCTVATNGFVHYGTKMHDGAMLEADAFLMKGSVVEGRTRWSGNPAQDSATLRDPQLFVEKGAMKW